MFDFKNKFLKIKKNILKIISLSLDFNCMHGPLEKTAKIH
jgi:hypothetical protein